MPFLKEAEQHLRNSLGVRLGLLPYTDHIIRSAGIPDIKFHYGENPMVSRMKRPNVKAIISEEPLAVYIRVGNHLFVNSDWKNGVQSFLHNNDGLYYDHKDTYLDFLLHLPYNVVTIAAILNLRKTFKGERVIDAGCNDGVLGTTCITTRR